MEQPIRPLRPEHEQRGREGIGHQAARRQHRDASEVARRRALARAQAREVAWAQAAETGRLISSTVGGFTIPGLVLDMDASIVVCHSEKESAAKTWKKTWQICRSERIK